jgi:hypothetical protein
VLQRIRLAVSRTAISVILVAIAVTASAEVVVLDSRATFLRTHADPDAIDSTPVELAELGLAPGDTISLRRVGTFDFGEPFPENATLTIGVFSASAELADPDVVDRVAEAIDAGDDADTPATFYGELSTAIPEAFFVDARAGGDDPSGPVVTLVIPDGATHLFLAAADRQYGDNLDTDSDYGVEIRTDAVVARRDRPLRVAWFRALD